MGRVMRRRGGHRRNTGEQDFVIAKGRCSPMQGRRERNATDFLAPLSRTPFLPCLHFQGFLSRLTLAVVWGRQVMWKIEVFLLSRQKNYFRRFFCRHAVYCFLQNTRFVQLSGENSAETRPQLRLPNSWFI